MFTQVTIKDVAKAAGVHFTTVSMALRAHPAIAAPTRRRIERLAALLGYRRNEVFSALSHQRREQRQPRAIPTLIYLGRARTDRNFFAMDHHRELMAGATKAAERLGYALEAHVVGPSGIPPERLQARLIRTKAAGVVIGAWDPVLSVPAVDWARWPTVKIDSRHVPAHVPFVSFDQMNAVLVSFRKLRALGYRRIGLALGEKDEDATDGLHLSGWCAAQQEAPQLPPLPPLFFPPDATFNQIKPLLAQWIKTHQLDAVMGNWWSIPLALRHLTGRIPPKLGFVCLCRGRGLPQVAGIQPNFEVVGQRAISLLGSLINSPGNHAEVATLTSLVEGSWHDGKSIEPQN